MQPYGQYCPVARAAELLGDRWTLLIVRELLFGPLRFTEIERGLPGISRSVLAQRLRRLQHDRIIEAVPEHTGGGYRFTVAGEELRPVLQTLGDWVSRWLMADPTPAECDPELLTLWISRRVNTEALPGRRVVVEFRYHGERPLWAWLVLEPGDISVCLHDPCLPVDLTVRGHPRDLYRVYSGRSTLAAEISAERIELDGLPAMRRVPILDGLESLRPSHAASRGVRRPDAGGSWWVMKRTNSRTCGTCGDHASAERKRPSASTTASKPSSSTI